MSQGDAPASVAAASSEDHTDTANLLFDFLRQGRSFSGHERNCCFLNTGGGRFADVSSVTGLDFPDDGRAVSLVDWDHDGDLDLWIANRNGPQLRFLRNDVGTDHHWIAVRLEGNGTTTNRDAIGARVEVRVESGERRVESVEAEVENLSTLNPQSSTLAKTLRAGDGFLSQSTKWLHFGLGKDDQIDRVVVHWPGGEAEEFTGLVANRHYRMVQSSSSAEPWDVPGRSVALKSSRLIEPAASDQARIVSAVLLLLPQLSFQTFDGQYVVANPPDKLPGDRKPMLLNLWASWCRPCLSELDELSSQHAQLRANGIEVVALSVDNLGDTKSNVENARKLARRLELPFTTGTATVDTVEKLQLVHDFLFDDHRPLPIPTSFLIDSLGRLAVIYTGKVEVAQVLADASQLRLDHEAWRDASLPFAGRRLESSVRLALLPLAAELVDHGFVDDALRFVAAYRKGVEDDPGFSKFLMKLASALRDRGDDQQAEIVMQGAVQRTPKDSGERYRLGRDLHKQGHLDAAAKAFREAIELDPEMADAHAMLGMVLSMQGDHRKAIPHYRKALEIDPTLKDAHGNLANTLFTVRNFPEAAKHYRRLLAIDDKHAMAHFQLGNSLAAQGLFTDAIHHFRRSVQLDPTSADAHDKLGLALSSTGNSEAAIAYWEKALELKPEFIVTLNNLAWTLATDADSHVRRPEEAVQYAKRASRLSKSQVPTFELTLAVAHAAAGQYGDAVIAAERALRLASAKGGSQMANEIRKRLEAYRQQQPYPEGGTGK